MTATTWTSAECAAFLAISEEALRQHRRRGDGPPFVKLGRTVRYVPAHVAKWLEENKRHATKPARSIGVVS